MNLKQKKKLTICILTFVVILLIGSGTYAYSLHNSYKTNLQKGENLMNEGKYEEAKETFSNLKSRKYFTKNLTLLDSYISKADLLSNSSNNFKEGEALFTDKKYLEAIEKYKNVDIKDINYEESQKKITLSNNQYIDDKLSEAKELVSNKNYKDALVILDDLLTTYTDNQSVLALKDQYTSELEQQKKSEAQQSEQINTTGNTPTNTSGESADTTQSSDYPKVIVGKNIIHIKESPQDEGNFLRGIIISMGPGIGFDPQPLGLHYQITLGGNTSLSLSYTATLNFNGETYSKSGQFSYSSPGDGFFPLNKRPQTNTAGTITFTITYMGKQYTNSQEVVYRY